MSFLLSNEARKENISRIKVEIVAEVEKCLFFYIVLPRIIRNLFQNFKLFYHAFRPQYSPHSTS